MVRVFGMILFLLSFQIFDSLFCLTLGLCVCVFFFLILFLHSFQIHDLLSFSLGACLCLYFSFSSFFSDPWLTLSLSRCVCFWTWVFGGGGMIFRPWVGSWVLEKKKGGYNIWCSGVDPFLVQFFRILPEIKDCILWAMPVLSAITFEQNGPWLSFPLSFMLS